MTEIRNCLIAGVTVSALTWNRYGAADAGMNNRIVKADVVLQDSDGRAVFVEKDKLLYIPEELLVEFLALAEKLEVVLAEKMDKKEVTNEAPTGLPTLTRGEL